MTTNLSHTNCSHPSTSKDRAACRKRRASESVPTDLLATAPVITRVDVDDAPTLTTSPESGAFMTVGDARRITLRLLSAYGLNGWVVSFDNARRRAGACNYARRTILLSKPLLAQRSYADSMMTITHELAHALTPGHKHDHVWAAKHRELGGNGQRCFDHADETAPYIGVCAHGKTFSKYRAPRPGAQYRCKCVYGDKTPFSFAPNPNA